MTQLMSYKEATEEEKRQIYNIGLLMISKVYKDGLPPADFIVKNAKYLEGIIGLDEKEIQESLNVMHSASMKLAFKSNHSEIGFKRD